MMERGMSTTPRDGHEAKGRPDTSKPRRIAEEFMPSGHELCEPDTELRTALSSVRARKAQCAQEPRDVSPRGAEDDEAPVPAGRTPDRDLRPQLSQRRDHRVSSKRLRPQGRGADRRARGDARDAALQAPPRKRSRSTRSNASKSEHRRREASTGQARKLEELSKCLSTLSGRSHRALLRSTDAPDGFRPSPDPHPRAHVPRSLPDGYRSAHPVIKMRRAEPAQEQMTGLA